MQLQDLIIASATQFAKDNTDLIAQCNAGDEQANARYSALRDAKVSKLTGLHTEDSDEFDNACSDFDYYVEQESN